MPRIWTDRLVLLAVVLTLGGCTTNKEELLPHDGTTMLDIWNVETGGGDTRQLLDARQALRRPLTEADIQATPGVQARYIRTAQTEVYSQFHRLPNPDLVLYVFPHLAGTDPVPVPGYSTIFPLYQRVQYALPGERVEDY